ncbi:uncharacterized protein LOC133884728 isoform X1 [Phragmites australis]|uniref:uncharacterized protein LOC133884728 isoform X1 n=1 Tax=Phragmites australis TaxID=29695 RepID=UPI002D79E908|nr:uncharacterized protein LOC133884728 isoform X1 [Phragmites australis]
MRRLRIGKVLGDCFSFSLCTGTCVCIRALEDEEEVAVERKALMSDRVDQVLRLRDLADGTRTLGFHLEPKVLDTDPILRHEISVCYRHCLVYFTSVGFAVLMQTVELRVSMHCNGCARKVQKHITKMEGVTSFEVDLESKKVVVMGDVTPLEVLQSISKVKFAQLWMAPTEPTKGTMTSYGVER